jgi:hypothetical protein
MCAENVNEKPKQDRPDYSSMGSGVIPGYCDIQAACLQQNEA